MDSKTIIALAREFAAKAANELPMCAPCDLREELAKALIRVVTDAEILDNLHEDDDDLN